MRQELDSILQKLGEVSGLEYRDENCGQLDDYSPHFPVKFPLCLVDIQGVNYSDIGGERSRVPQRMQEATATIAFTVAHQKLTSSSGKAPAEQKQAAWLIYEVVENIHKVLHGYRPTERCGALMRSSFRKVMRDDGIQQCVVFYTMGMHSV